MLASLPNLLTLSRIAVIPVMIALFLLPYDWAVWTNLGLFALACLTDYLDGLLARRLACITPLGRFLDPIADKLLVAAVLFMLAATARLEPLAVVPAVVILLREVLISGLREFLAGIGVGLPVSRLAKWKTGVQMGAIALAMVPQFLKAGLKKPIHFALSYDEEVGCIGVGRMIRDLTQAGIQPASCIVGEPTLMHLGVEPRWAPLHGDARFDHLLTTLRLTIPRTARMTRETP